MADIFQGSPAPALTEVKQTGTTAPEFYTNYLQDIANLGQAGVQMGGVAGLSPLQIQAMNMAPSAAFSGLGTMGTGAELATAAGSTAAPQLAGAYMNPYQQNVVDEMARLQGRNIRENVMPALKGAAGAMGQFGSSRQFQATGQTLRDMQANLLGQQQQALQSGYQNAITNAQADLQRQMQSGQVLGGLGQFQQTGAIKGLETLGTLGGAEQAQAQREMDYPMAQAQNFAKLLQGYQVPMTTTEQRVGSQAYSNSPLAQIQGLLGVLGGFAGGTAFVPSTTGITAVPTNTPKNP
jgi:hypothetical protein